MIDAAARRCGETLSPPNRHGSVRHDESTVRRNSHDECLPRNIGYVYASINASIATASIATASVAATPPSGRSATATAALN